MIIFEISPINFATRTRWSMDDDSFVHLCWNKIHVSISCLCGSFPLVGCEVALPFVRIDICL